MAVNGYYEDELQYKDKDSVLTIYFYVNCEKDSKDLDNQEVQFDDVCLINVKTEDGIELCDYRKYLPIAARYFEKKVENKPELVFERIKWDC